MMEEFVVVGAGVTGMTAAYELSSLGAKVTVVEKSTLVGGHVSAASYCCKATSGCARCGVCVAHTQLNQSLQDPGIAVRTGSTVEAFSQGSDGISVQIRQRDPSIAYEACVSCDACVEVCPNHCITKYSRAELTQYDIDYDSCLRSSGEPCTACADACPAGAIATEERSVTVHGQALLLATGHTAFEASRKPRYGYGTSDRIITGLEAERALSSSLNFGDPGESVALVQCVGSRDPSIGRNFCSGVCCAYAVRMARMLKFNNPDMQLTIYYIDLQNFDRRLTDLLDETRRLGVDFVQGIPFMIEAESDGRIALTIEAGNGSHEKSRFDRVILSVGIDSREDAGDLASVIGLERDSYGFFRTSGPRVYSAGTCAGPMSIPESMEAARAVAARMSAK